MLFGSERRFDKWKRLCDVCIRKERLKLRKVDSEDDFAMCYNMWSTDIRLLRFTYVDFSVTQ